MLGAIAGDIIGSRFERGGRKSMKFKLFSPRSAFTDDTVLTIAIAEALLENRSYKECVRSYALQFPNRGYGKSFIQWVKGDVEGPYNSWGNGSAMRVSPIAYAFNELTTILKQAEASAAITHNHPEGIKGAQATAAAIFWARTGKSKTYIKEGIEQDFGYDLNRNIDDIRPDYQFDVSCQGSVPESIIAFLESEDLESAIRLAVSLGGDTDTMACIAGAIAEAYYRDIPDAIALEIKMRLPVAFMKVLHRFYQQFVT